MRRAVANINEAVSDLDKKLLAVPEQDSLETIVELSAERSRLMGKKTRFEHSINSETSKMGVAEREQLTKKGKIEFITYRINAYALLIRVRSRMQDRRFEMDRLERSYRTAVNGT